MKEVGLQLKEDGWRNIRAELSEQEEMFRSKHGMRDYQVNMPQMSFCLLRMGGLSVCRRTSISTHVLNVQLGREKRRN